MKTVYLDVIDPPLRLGSNTTLRDTCIVRAPVTYGRVLFRHDACVEVLDGAENWVIQGCMFRLGHVGKSQI